MPSGKSSSERPRRVDPWWSWALLRKNCTRFWPIWAGYLVVWVLLLPAAVLVDGWEPDYALNLLNPVALVLTMFFSILSAMAVFSYLYSSRAALFFHSLPLRREGLFFTDYVSGALFLLAPQGAVFLLTLALQAGQGFLRPGPLLLWLVSVSLMAVFFYSFAVFCAMFTGNLVALPVFYGILNFLALGMAWLVNDLLEQFVYGFNGLDALEQVGRWLSPVFNLSWRLGVRYDNGFYALRGLPILLLYALVGLALAALALAVYRRRALESAGDIVAVGWVRPVFKYGVGFCAAVALGAWLYALFQSALPSGPWPVLAFLLLCALLGYFAAEMLLKKSFKVFSRSWKGALALCLVLALASGAMVFDVVGFNRAPTLSAVRSVTLQGAETSPWDSAGHANLTFTSEEDIQTVLALHRTLAQRGWDNQRALEEGGVQRARPIALDHGGTLPEETAKVQNVTLKYQMANGSVLHRQYTFPITREDLKDPGSPASLLDRLLNRPDNVERLYFTDIPEDALLVDVFLQVYDTETGAWENAALKDDADRNALLAAVRDDLAAGRLGKRFLFDDLERYETCYTSDLKLNFYKSLPADQLPASDGPAAADSAWSGRVTVTLQSTASETLALLRELGVLDDTHVLLNHVQNETLAARDEGNAEGQNGYVNRAVPAS